MSTNNENKAYIAGYLDGEGCFYIRKQKAPSYKRGYCLYAAIAVSSVDPWVLEMIRGRYGGSVAVVKPRDDNHKPLYVLTLTSRLCIPLITDILPHLRLKKKQAALILELQADCKRGHNQTTKIDWSWRDTLYEKIRKLNRRGPQKSA